MKDKDTGLERDDGDAGSPAGGGGGLCACFGGGGKGERLRSELSSQRLLLKRLVRTKYEGHGVTATNCANGDGINIHARLLATVYRRLTRAGGKGSGETERVQAIGAHWDALGFQGTDPATDLNRSGGLLNLVHLLHFVSTEFETLQKIHKLSHDARQHFPLAVASIHYTKLALDVFLNNERGDRELTAAHAKLIRYVNRAYANNGPNSKAAKSSVLDSLCRFQNSMLFGFWERWRYDQRTVAGGGFDRTYKEIVSQVRKNPVALIDSFDAYLRGVKAASSGAGLEFADLDAEQRRASQGARAAEQKRSDEEQRSRMRKYAQAD